MTTPSVAGGRHRPHAARESRRDGVRAGAARPSGSPRTRTKSAPQAPTAWAREVPTLAWIDLGVFGPNAAARALYARAGFVETGRRADYFRVRGAPIEDVSMSLSLR